MLLFCRHNGFKYVTFVNLGVVVNPKLTVMASLHGIRTRIFNHLNIKLDPMDFLIILKHENNQNLDNKALDVISAHRVQKSLLVNYEHDWDSFEMIASQHLKNGLFYLHDGNFMWKQVMILKDNPKVVINDVVFNHNGLVLINEDLQGVELLGTTLTWSPFVSISGCNSVGRNCHYEGVLVDLMNFWSKKLNFTWDLYEDINGDWGYYPKTGESWFSPLFVYYSPNLRSFVFQDHLI